MLSIVSEGLLTFRCQIGESTLFLVLLARISTVMYSAYEEPYWLVFKTNLEGASV